jgi:hypothetical protein
MTRPHEDLERHTIADHRPGGVPIHFEPNAWCAIDIAHVKAERVDAGISAYETLIEKARDTSETRARVAVVLRSTNNRRVISLLEIEGHDAFRHLQSAWDDHHLAYQRHDVAESSTLALYRLAATAGDASIDPETKDTYSFEHVTRSAERVHAIANTIAAAEGFRGALIFGFDDDSASVIIFRFAHAHQFDTFRASAAAQQGLGPVGAGGVVHPVRTFG